ncbi:MAG TPA: M55 family metallopeptidase [Longimicrobiales bacterium]
MRACLLVLSLLFSYVGAATAQDPRFANKRVPFEPGFRVYFIVDMEGMGSAVHMREVIAGNEGERYRDRTGPDYWNHYRGLLTDEVNAAIAGARSVGARSFVVNEGHGGNLFANLLPWQLDQEAILIRGYPKPMVMSTGIDSTFGALLFTAAHSSAGTGGVMSHNYAFDQFSVNGTALNEPGINALVAGEFGVPLVLVAGDDVVVDETRKLFPDIVGVVVKTAVGGNAAITWSPKRVQQMLRDSTALAVKRAQEKRYRPFVLAKPYRVEFTLRRSFPEEYVTGVDQLAQRYRLQKGEGRTYRMTTSSAREIAYLLDEIERVVLR